MTFQSNNRTINRTILVNQVQHNFVESPFPIQKHTGLQISIVTPVTIALLIGLSYYEFFANRNRLTLISIILNIIVIIMWIFLLQHTDDITLKFGIPFQYLVSTVFFILILFNITPVLSVYKIPFVLNHLTFDNGFAIVLPAIMCFFIATSVMTILNFIYIIYWNRHSNLPFENLITENTHLSKIVVIGTAFSLALSTILILVKLVSH